MKLWTKQKRIVAMFEAYLKVKGKKSATSREVSEWAIANDLYPIPTLNDSSRRPAICKAWEDRLDALISKAQP